MRLKKIRKALLVTSSFKYSHNLTKYHTHFSILELPRENYSRMVPLPLPPAKRKNMFDMLTPHSSELEERDVEMYALPSPESEEGQSCKHTLYSTGLKINSACTPIHSAIGRLWHPLALILTASSRTVPDRSLTASAGAIGRLWHPLALVPIVIVSVGAGRLRHPLALVPIAIASAGAIGRLWHPLALVPIVIVSVGAGRLRHPLALVPIAIASAGAIGRLWHPLALVPIAIASAGAIGRLCDLCPEVEPLKPATVS